MNVELIKALESAVSLLAAWEDRAGEGTVGYEIIIAKVHVQRAIDWEKLGGPWSGPRPARPEIEKVNNEH